MKKQDVSLEAFQVIGIKTRTSNEHEMKGAGKIPALWNQFFAEQILSQIPGKLNQDVVAVYHDYESDAKAPYSLLIGVKVAPGTKAPMGLELLSIPRQEYTRLTTRKGEMPSIVIEAWQAVWELSEVSKMNRKYSFDFEIYDERSADPTSAEVDLYIAVG